MGNKINPLDFCSAATDEIEEAFNTGAITIAVIGTGHIGLLLACNFAQANANVIGVDVNQDIVDRINSGKGPFFELESEELVKNNVARGKLKATKNLSQALDEANVVVISVPTPLDEKREPDLMYITQAAKDVGKQLRRGFMVVIASTVYIGATRNVILPTLERYSGLKVGRDFLLACVPQRIDPGNRIHRLDNTPLNVGGIDEKSTEMAAVLFRRIVEAEVKKVSSAEVAECAKLVENTYRDVNIALVNELSIFLRRLGINVMEVIDACSTKWSFQAHFPGAGVGGPCIPINPHYLLHNASSSELKMVRLAREINDGMPDHVVNMIVKGLQELVPKSPIHKPKVAVLGLTYKKDVEDTRGSPAERVIKELNYLSFEVAVHDPVLPLSTVKFGCQNLPLEEAVKDADCLLFLTDHTAFKKPAFNKFEILVHDPCLLVDTKRIFSPSDFSKTKFHYQSI
ncbi:MAG: nucleotide sugar dehydrogenase [Candidatus Bathyarchaeota archaeon]|nr:nucleotide sugar dehydrogenase [Candidatus Bathyarchaeota archaeon]MDH5788468.1 nucleotide sugar dehydrogenase [Candidatus Bathyarchaeota archaeon]